ncbi:uncharacterized protein LODBEIA_P08930 [Lodderomyces beijingensis]|uniref:peptidyl-tRNA hydrolase n=1 Tax=Lodderomyces beijingensis TaxID=1775926 RepID=A0ABP0ZET4_9ASCO
MNNTLVTVGIVSFLSGALLSQWLLAQKVHSRPRKLERYLSSDDEAETEDDDEQGEEEDDVEIESLALNEVPGEVRMTLCVRQDLKMGKGKAAAQCSHATLSLYKKITNPNSPAYNPEMVRRWEYGNGQAKITLQVPNQEEMDLLFAKAMSLGINACIIHDAGRTQIAAGSATVLGLGPAPKRTLDEVTGKLKLY